ncbi:cystatin-C-like [Macrotis lagotis]|uniref:cystatin-C-like n=1 Tax=Macrotis lagotis TaxID=92651 RepID=UPI003D685CA3
MAGLRCLVLLLALVLAAEAAQAAAQATNRAPRLIGGLRDADVNEEGVKRALNFAMVRFNQGSNDRFASRVFEVLEAKKQIVAGVKYLFKVAIRRTTCSKSVNDFSNCPFHESPQMKTPLICSFSVYDIPWMNKTTLLDSECLKN